MIKRFSFELITGIIGIISILIFGKLGMIALILLSVLPFFSKKKNDERENQLFNKVGNYTAALTLVACVGLFMTTDFIINGYKIGDLWLFFVIFSFLVAHGITGLIVFKKN